jgi:hypothetical protein
MTSKYAESFVGTFERLDAIIRKTDNPHHRAILLNYRQHGLLEVSGRYEEFLTPDKMVEHPIYHMDGTVLDGMDQVRGFYQELERNGAIVLWPVEQALAVADWGFAGEATFNHFVPGKMLAQDGEEIDDPEATYLVTMTILQQWPYDEWTRLIGENFFEYRSRRVVTKPDPVDVITPAEARRLYAPVLANPPFPIPS